MGFINQHLKGLIRNKFTHQNIRVLAFSLLISIHFMYIYVHIYITYFYRDFKILNMLFRIIFQGLLRGRRGGGAGVQYNTSIGLGG